MESKHDLLFLVLTHIGYRQGTGFLLLEKLKNRFFDMFDEHAIASAKEYSLSKVFSGEVESTIRYFQPDSYDKIDDALDLVTELKKDTLNNLNSTLSRDSKFETLLSRTEDLTSTHLSMPIISPTQPLSPSILDSPYILLPSAVPAPLVALPKAQPRRKRRRGLMSFLLLLGLLLVLGLLLTSFIYYPLKLN